MNVLHTLLVVVFFGLLPTLVRACVASPAARVLLLLTRAASRLRVTMVGLPFVGHLEPLIGLGEALANNRQRTRVRLLTASVRCAARVL